MDTDDRVRDGSMNWETNDVLRALGGRGVFLVVEEKGVLWIRFVRFFRDESKKRGFLDRYFFFFLLFFEVCVQTRHW